MYTTGKLTFIPGGLALASHDDYLPHAGSLSPENTPDPEPIVSEEPGPRMTVTINTLWQETVLDLLQACALDTYLRVQRTADTLTLVFASDFFYRDVDRFCDHCQAIRLIKDWKIER